MARRKLRIDMVEEVEPTLAEPDSEESAMRGVGATLRAARERHGWSIADVAQQLRIRPPVLEAMEAGRFEKLPNGAYALGFVRSYADFLGLDRDEISRRVKAEAAALSARPELVFPKPLTESRMPSAVVLAVSLVLAVGGYGLWYYHSANVRLAAPRVDAVPPRLAAQVEPPKPSARDAAAATVAEPSASPAAGSTAQTETGAASPSAPASATAPADATAPAGAAPAPAEPPAAGSSAAAAPSTPAPASASSEPAPAAPQVAALPATPAPPPPAAESKPAAAPKQYGDTDGNPRIVLKATADSWVQIRDHGGAIIFSRILRPGDSYAVPNRPGLVMATGSAGALDIVVDGKPAPAIGRVGFTRKDVPLDPERLLDGTAVVENAHPHAPAKPAAKPAEPHEAAPAEPHDAAPTGPAAAPSPAGQSG